MPYKSLTDSKLREMELQVEEAMRNAGMTIVGNPLGQHAAVSVEDVMWMHSLMSHDSVPFETALFILRRKLFPFMHDPHPWIRDKPEESEDVMKSIMAIYLYRRKIEDLKHHLSDPANFLDYL